MLRLFDVNNRDITDELDYNNNPSCLEEPWYSAWGICKVQEPVEQAMEPETRHGLQSHQVLANMNKQNSDKRTLNILICY